jgi:predicted Zn finger-like uncharacterized protein
MIVTCPTCEASYRVPPSVSNRTALRCARCRQLIPTVQQAAAPPPEDPALSQGADKTVVARSSPFQRKGIQVSLAVVEGPDKGAKFALTKPRVTLGRFGVDILLNDPEVSKHHAAISVADENYTLEDLNSTNGTYLNGKRVSQAPLGHLDEIWIGGTKLFFTVVKPTFEPSARPHGAPDPGRKQVLLVEGHPLLGPLADLLARDNVEVIRAGDGREARELLGRPGPPLDLLVLDLQLEAANGADFLAWLREPGQKGRAPILALTHVYTLPEILQALGGLEVAAVESKASPPAEIAACATRLLYPRAGEQRVTLVPANIDVLCWYGRETIRGVITSLGTKGMTIEAHLACRPGSEVELIFALPEAPHVLRGKGRVRAVQKRLRSVHLDVEFLELEAPGASQLAPFVFMTFLTSPTSPQ